MKSLKVAGVSLLIALAFLGLGEGALRLIGWGAPVEDPYLDIAGDQRVYESDGDWMETRADRQRLFRPQRFDVDKKPHVKRIFCLGGSDVYGFPYTADGAWPAMLQGGLDSVSPGGYEVINSAGIAYASYRALRVFREVIGYQPDAIVVMTGHNEFLEQRVYAEPLGVNPTVRNVRTAFGRLYLFNVIRQAIVKSSQPKKALLGEKVSWDYVPRDAEQKRITEEHFRYSLTEMAMLGRAEGVPVIFATMPCNLKDYPPLGGDGSDEAHKLYAKGRELLKAGKTDEAYLAFRQAADLDDHPVRAFSSYNAIIRDVAGSTGEQLADVDLAFRSASGGIPGDNLFLDHVHFRSEGAALVADVVADSLAQAGLIPTQQVAAVKKGIAAARANITAQEEGWARYGAAYEASHYLHLYDRARQLLKEAIKLNPTLIEARQMLRDLPTDETPESQGD